MIDRVLNPFDFLLQMPIEQQCWHAIGVSFAGFCLAALIRETATAPCLRITARALGAGAYFFVAAFALYATHEVEKLNQIVSQKYVSPTANPISVVAVAEEYSTIVGGQTVSLRKYSDGRFGPVSVTSGRENRVWYPVAGSVDNVAERHGIGHGANDGVDNVQNVQSGKSVRF